MSDLAHTKDPNRLVPGDISGVRRTASDWRNHGTNLDGVSTALSAVALPESWTGDAADAFNEKFSPLAKQFADASHAVALAANALDRYGDVLDWAKDQAQTAIDLWAQAQQATLTAQAAYERDSRAMQKEHDQFFLKQGVTPFGSPPLRAFVDPGDALRAEADETLAAARNYREAVGYDVADVINSASDAAPSDPNGWAVAGAALALAFQVGFGDAVDFALDAAVNTGNTLASLGNAIINHPEYLLEVLGGLSLLYAGVGGEVGGVALDATGVGAIAGVPINIASAGAIAAGVGIASAGTIQLATEAAGNSRVQPFNRQAGRNRGDGRDARGRFATGNGGARADPYVKEQKALDELETELGVPIERTQVRAKVDGADNHRYFDGLYKNSDGTYTAVEVKSGTATKDPNQRLFDGLISRDNPGTARLNGEQIKIVEVVERKTK